MSEKKVPFSKDWGYNLVRTEAWTDTNKMMVESKQDVTAIMKLNKIQRNETDIKFNSKYDRTGRWHHAARIPNIVVDQLMRETAPSGKKKWFDKKYMRRWLNDSANKAWRTGGGWI
jgi:hypothetical protein